MITYDELKKLAELAKLSLDGEDIGALANDISSILEFAETIDQAAVDSPDSERTHADWSFREDILQPSYPVEDILSNAGERQNGFFVARRKGGPAE